jgi:glycosyltransferase involved in cell wall biosynthesis
VTPQKRPNAVASGRTAEITQRLKPVCLGPLPENPLVSVLTGNYNYASFLGEAIESVLAQTYTRFEMIVCDDGSTDKSCQVAEQYTQCDPRVRLIRQQNGGQASAWNTAYRECRGDIICFLDADDRFLPEKLEKVVQGFRSYPESGFVGHRIYRISVDGRRDDVFPLINDPPSGWYGPFVVCSGTSPPAMAFGSALCLRREISDLIFPLPERFRICADGVVMALGSLMTPLIGIPAPLAEYRYHGGNGWDLPQVSSESVNHLRDIQWKMWEISREYLGKVDPLLVETFPAFDKCHETLLTAYVQARLQLWGGALSAYRELLRSEGFRTIQPIWKWFWRFSILLPRPVLFYAISSNRPKQLLRKALGLRRRLFAN